MKKIVTIVTALMLTTSNLALAQSTPATSDQINALQQQLDALKAQLDALKAAQAAPATTPAPPINPPNQGQPGAGQSTQGPPQTDIFGRPVDAQGRTVDFAPKPSPTPIYVQVKKGDSLTFFFGGSKDEATLYGNLDLSFDDTTKGLKNYYPVSNDSPVGHVGFQTGISTNLSYLGVRGQHIISPNHTSLVYQLETQIDVSATSGLPVTNSNNDTTVKGGLTSRNSFIGIADTGYGSFKIGKTDAPYKTSTARMNPFSGELGDNSVIMGNTGGDNRVEFGTRLDHALWYESPTVYGLTFNALVSPGQNRGYDDSQIPAGETSCAGGNVPGSGALPPACNDGSYGTAYSASVGYTTGKLYATGAYEYHADVNRVSDVTVAFPPPAGLDVAPEIAQKIGAQYSFSKATVVSGIYEYMQRNVPDGATDGIDLQSQNERTRHGTWLALTQYVTPKTSLNFGWARAGQANGDPGQHNTLGFQPSADNSANLYTFAFKQTLDKHVAWYLDYAQTANHPYAHYDLGAGGRGLTTDCHDASPEAAFDPNATPVPVSGNGPHCYAGGRLQGVSAGLDFKF
jgi:predicted porin